MIITTKDDVVRLSGALVKNHWLTIKAAATQLLEEHPEGIIINCEELGHVSEDGAKTFLEAMKDIQAAGARIVVCNLPDNVLQVIRSVPGVRSQLPIANSEEEARASLRLSGTAPAVTEEEIGEKGIVVPLLPGLDADYAVNIAAQVTRLQRAPVHLVYLLVVARNLPLDTPLPAEEEAANRMLSQAAQAARKHNVLYVSHLERVRDPEEGILQVIKNSKAAHAVLSGFPTQAEDDRFHALVEVLLYRAPCNVLIARRAPETAASGPLPGLRDEV